VTPSLIVVMHKLEATLSLIVVLLLVSDLMLKPTASAFDPKPTWVVPFVIGLQVARRNCEVEPP
jgi:hypothetical protein